jgi:GAF domain-containing protein
MTLQDVVGLVNLLALGGVAWWIVGWIRSLKGAVDAQEKTIKAQTNLVETLRTVLDAIDTPQMVKRYTDYKKIVDHEKDIWEQSVRRQWNEEKHKSSRSLDIIASLIVYVPLEERKKAIEKSDFDDQIKRILLRIADYAPDFSPSQMATSEILRVLASSTDSRSVLDVIVRNAARLCDAHHSSIHRVHGNFMKRVATLERFPSALIGEEIPLTRDRLPALAIIDKKTISAIDKDVPIDIEIPAGSHIMTGRMTGLHGVKTMVATPLLREGKEKIGCIVVGRLEYRPFTAKEIFLLEILADQAVIAIEPRGSGFR